jgi:hypothetical protein
MKTRNPGIDGDGRLGEAFERIDPPAANPVPRRDWKEAFRARGRRQVVAHG